MNEEAPPRPRGRPKGSKDSVPRNRPEGPFWKISKGTPGLIELAPKTAEYIVTLSARRTALSDPFFFSISITLELARKLGWRKEGKRSQIKAHLNSEENILILSATSLNGWSPAIQRNRMILKITAPWLDFDKPKRVQFVPFVLSESAKTISIHLPSWAKRTTPND